MTRPSLHRSLQRHGVCRLPDVDRDQPKRPRSGAHPVGHFHVDIAQVSTEHGELRLSVAVDRTSEFAFVRCTGRRRSEWRRPF